MPGKRSTVRKTADEYVIGGFSYLIVGVFALLCFVPILLVVIYSFTPYDLYLKNHFDFFPSRLTLDAYRMVTNYRYIWTGYGNTLYITFFGSILSLVVLVLTGYPLSKKDLKGRNVYITFFGSILSLIVLVLTGYPLSKKDLKGRNVYMTLWIITMFFSGGMIPNYFLIRTLGLLNNRWSLILPGLVSCYNLILMKNYIQGLPGSLEEAALIDGANDLVVLVRIVLPLSAPILATLGLFTAVGYWNSYFNAIMYMTKRANWPLQLVLRELLFESAVNEMTAMDERVSTPFLLKMASIVVATVPIMCIYPFLQKYFMTGLALGGVKE